MKERQEKTEARFEQIWADDPHRASVQFRYNDQLINCNSMILEAVELAEREGFEPSVEFPLHTLSKRGPSTTRPPLRKEGLNDQC